MENYTIKQLEWLRHIKIPIVKHGHIIIGEYYQDYQLQFNCNDNMIKIIGYYNTLEEAQAAAQEHYESLVLDKGESHAEK